MQHFSVTNYMHVFTLHLRLARYYTASGKAAQQLQCSAHSTISEVAWALCSNHRVREGETDAAGSTEREGEQRQRW